MSNYGYGNDRNGSRDGGGAGHLARIHGTEEDRVNCPFYFKIGACRHGEGCSRKHNKPVFSQTLLIKHIYNNPILALDTITQFQVIAKQKGYHDQPNDEAFEDFYMDVFEELSKYGEIEEMIVCDNIGEHMVGNLYVKFYDEEDAQKCLDGVGQGRYFDGRMIKAEYSPVTDFREARCRQFHDNSCQRKGECNFIHTKRIEGSLMRDLFKVQPHNGERSKDQRDGRKSERRSHRRRSKSRSRKRRSRSRSHSRRRKRHRRRERDRSSSREGRRRRSHRDRDGDRSRRRHGEREKHRSSSRRRDRPRERERENRDKVEAQV